MSLRQIAAKLGISFMTVKRGIEAVTQASPKTR
jgi:Trp operon repressor